MLKISVKDCNSLGREVCQRIPIKEFFCFFFVFFFGGAGGGEGGMCVCWGCGEEHNLVRDMRTLLG